MTGALLLTAALATAAGPQVVIRAPGIELTTADVAQRAEQLRAEGKPFTPEALVDGLESEVALAAEARRTKVDADPDARAYVAYGRQKLLAELYAREASNVAKPTEAEAREAFHLRQDSVRLQSIVVATREEAAAIRARLDKGGDVGAEAARSLDRAGAANKGDTGVLARIILDEAVAKAAFAAPKGGLIGPAQTRNGWLVARVLEATVGTEAEFTAARPQVEALIMSKSASAAREHVTEMVRKRATISIDDAFLASLGARTELTAAESDRTVLTINGKPFTYRQVAPAVRGASLGGHGGSAVRKEAVATFADELLLADEAHKKGIDARPATVALLARADVHLLAEYMGRRMIAELSQGVPAKERTGRFLKRLEACKKQNDVRVDRSAALAAVPKQGK